MEEDRARGREAVSGAEGDGGFRCEVSVEGDEFDGRFARNGSTAGADGTFFLCRLPK